MTDLTLIGLTGQAGTGKDAAATHLVREYGFIQVAFADPLRTMVEVLLDQVGVDYAYVYERELKERPVPVLGVSARALMQAIGTEAVRALDADLWVRHLEARLGLRDFAPIHDRIVISDVRFPNEAAWLQRQSGRLVRLRRDAAAPVRSHASELHVAALQADVDLWNNSPALDGLHELLDGVMADAGLDRREPVDPSGC